MSATPFQDRIRWLRGQGLTYEDIEISSGFVYSASWWAGVIRNGPRTASGTSTVDAPQLDKVAGIAKAFNITPERVCEMIAADWYGVTTGFGVSKRARNLIPLIDGLSEEDAALVASLLRRLNAK